MATDSLDRFLDGSFGCLICVGGWRVDDLRTRGS
jgi:hypothetical protein